VEQVDARRGLPLRAAADAAAPPPNEITEIVSEQCVLESNPEILAAISRQLPYFVRTGALDSAAAGGVIRELRMEPELLVKVALARSLA
jgi:hypothetical protein